MIPFIILAENKFVVLKMLKALFLQGFKHSSVVVIGAYYVPNGLVRRSVSHRLRADTARMPK